jgi:putative phage-type endonuclease
MRVIDVVQRSPQWLEWRAHGVSASEVAVILGRSPYKTPWRLWAEKTGLVRRETELSSDWFRSKGIAGEDPARRAFEDQHDTLLLALCGEADADPLLRASFDGIDNDGRPVELKVACQAVYQEVLDRGRESTAFNLYWPQVQTQLFVADQTQGWLVFWYGPGAWVEFEVERDDAFVTQTLIPECRAFWDRVLTGKEPDRDAERDLYLPSGPDLERWTKRAVDYRDQAARKAKLDAEVKKLKASMDVIEESLVAMMGDFLLAETAGLKVLRYCQRGNIGYKDALAAFCPDLDPQTLEAFRAATSDRVKVTVLKEERAAVPFNQEQLEAVRSAAEADQGFFF